MKRLDAHTLDRLYNNRALVPEHGEYFSRWAQTSAAARQSHPCRLDVPYGSGAGETLDVFPTADSGAPVLVFIHGGYWRSLDKSDHSFVGPAFAQRGACVVIPNYALCPAVTISHIVLQMVRMLDWTYRNIARQGGDPNRITIVGHSAGAHLTAMLRCCRWPEHAADLPRQLVKNALAISGLYELDSVRRTPFLQQSLRLDAEQVRRLSPAWLAPPRLAKGRGMLYTVAGGAESAAFLAQNQLLAKAWGKQVVPVSEVLPELNHFSVLDALVQPGHRLNQLANRLLADN